MVRIPSSLWSRINNMLNIHKDVAWANWQALNRLIIKHVTLLTNWLTLNPRDKEPTI